MDANPPTVADWAASDAREARSENKRLREEIEALKGRLTHLEGTVQLLVQFATRR